MPSQSRIKNTTFPRLPCSTVTGKSDPHKTWRQKRVACAVAECRQINLGASEGVAVSGSGTATVELLEPVSNMIRARWRVVAAVVFLLGELYGVAPTCVVCGCVVPGCVISNLIIWPSQRFCKVRGILQSISFCLN